MAIHQTPSQRKTVERVMHEFKHGELKTARGRRKVKNPRQAIAIALSEAGASKNDRPKERRHNLRLRRQRSAAAKPVRRQPKVAGAAHRAGLARARRGTSFTGKPDDAIFRGAPR